jgi:phosphoribosylanthranilate isomerase
MPTRVKICGITRLEDAQLAVELGASALGFNFYAPSPRYIEPGAARHIVLKIPPFVTSVGVFVDETDTVQVLERAGLAGVGCVQLHGQSQPVLDDVRQVLPVIVAVGVSETFSPQSLSAMSASAFLLDASHPELRGGTGTTFDWEVAKEAKRYGTIILAGGLTPANVGEAIRKVRPFAVDVASGVESSPGVKDPAKLRAFFAAVAEADREIESLLHRSIDSMKK